MWMACNVSKRLATPDGAPAIASFAFFPFSILGRRYVFFLPSNNGGREIQIHGNHHSKQRRPFLSIQKRSCGTQEENTSDDLLFSPRRRQVMAAVLLLRRSLLLVFVVLPFSSAKDSSASDVFPLLTLISSFNNTSGLSSWNNASTPCNTKTPWKGIVCLDGHVSGLRLAGMELSGTIDVSALARLPHLRSISFDNNSLYGKLPDFSKVPALKSIYLSKNRFDGPIPDDNFAGMTHLKKLWLNSNSLSGQIPLSISRLAALLELHLENNEFSGSIPDLTLPVLKSFSVKDNKLEGQIPPSFVTFAKSSFEGNPGLCGPPLSDPSACNAVTSLPPEPTATPKEIKSGKTTVVALVMLTVTLALIFVIVIVRKKREGGFDTLGYEKDDIYVMESQAGSSHVKRQGSSTRQGSSRSRWHDWSKKGSRRSTAGGELVMVNEEKGTFGLPDLMKAAAEVLGNGSLGSVYKAVLANGMRVVVKRMREMNRQNKEAFDIEMRKLGRLRHPNVITPLGYHYRKDEKLLVFEYVEKGSLLFLLHGDRGPYHTELNWTTRLRIILGICRGLAYIHHQLSGNEVPHGNLKSGNVLLGHDFTPVLADYGYSPFLQPAQSAVSLFAYQSPEYTHYRHISSKSDLYCLGIIILEVLTGQFPSQYMGEGKGGSDVVQWVCEATAEGREGELLDLEITEGGVVDGMESLLRLGVDLVNANPDKRPELTDVVNRVEEIVGKEGGGESIRTMSRKKSSDDGGGGGGVGERSLRRGSESNLDFGIS